MCVWPAIGSAPGSHRDMRPVSLEPVWSGRVKLGENLAENWQVAGL